MSKLNNSYFVYQIKDVIEQYKKRNPDKKTPAFKSKGKKDLLKILEDLNINISNGNYDIVLKNPKPPRKRYQPTKKKVTKEYSTDEQLEYINNLSKLERYANPLKALNKYVDKEGNEKYLEPLEHQKKFIKQFIYSNLRGAIVFHGVGSGKTLTAVISSYFYLKIYPDHKVIVISPSALLYNFIDGMKQYGLDIKDNRYSFFTYDQYIKRKIADKNTLLIVDEAHNLRTPFKILENRDPETNETLPSISATNQRGFNILKFGAMFCHKIILLSGTVFVNKLYDIENLLAMVDQRMPIDIKAFEILLNDADNLSDYFAHRISYHKSEYSEFFPKRIDVIEALEIDENLEKSYDKIKKKGIPMKAPSEKPNSFYSAERYASNTIVQSGKKYNPKIRWIMNKVKEKKNEKFIIYSALHDAGIKLLEGALNVLEVGYKKITGMESSRDKEESKRYFNGYNFGDENFFDMNLISQENKKYINSKFRVLLISRAGSEGVDTVNCENLVLLDNQWNDASSEQIIARAIRFKSHIRLPADRRQVHVYRLLLANKASMPLMKVITKPNFNSWVKLNNEIRTNTELALEMYKKENEKYLPTVKELKELKGYKKEVFIPENTIETRHRGSIGRKGYSTFNLGWNNYNNLKSDDERKKWRIKKYSDWYSQYGFNEINEQNEKNKFFKELLGKKSPITNEMLMDITIDIRLLIMAKSKQENIDGFVIKFGNSIKLFEQYELKLLPKMEEKERELGRVLTDEEQVEIYTEYLRNERINIIRNKYAEANLKIQVFSKAKKLQQYFTNDKLAEDLVDRSGINDLDDTNAPIQILEPTAGEGALIKPVLEIQKDVHIDLCEISDDEREILQEMVDDGNNVLKLLDHKNFLNLICNEKYDIILMNPPFNIEKSTNGSLLRSVHDIDFVKRAFAMLKIGGKLVSITSCGWINNKDVETWLNNENKKSNYEIRKGEKFTNNVKLDIVILEITKLSNAEDEDILDIKFYKGEGEKGKRILDNIEEIPKD